MARRIIVLSGSPTSSARARIREAKSASSLTGIMEDVDRLSVFMKTVWPPCKIFATKLLTHLYESYKYTGMVKNVRVGSVIYPLRVTATIGRQIKAMAKVSGLSEADVMRLSIARGMPTLEKFFTKSKGNPRVCACEKEAA